MGQNKAIRATRLLCVAINQRKILQQHGFDDEKFELPICKIKLQKLIGERVEEEDAGECKGKIILHHRDSNHDNNPDDGSNWEALCASHHRILHPRAKSTIDTSRTKKLENQKVKLLKNNDILQWQSENKVKKLIL